MTTMPKPTVILVHGAWHIPAHYEAFVSSLRKHDFEVHCPRVPTCTTPTTSTFADDVECISTLAASLADRCVNIILVMHSYGGAVGTEAAKHLSTSSRRAAGLDGGIVHLVYMCAFMLQSGSACAAAASPHPEPDPIHVHDDGTTSICEDPAQLFYHDVDSDLARRCATFLTQHNIGALVDGAVTHEAWREIPSVYIECTEDRMLLPTAQTSMIEDVRERGIDLQVRRCGSGHSPFLSRTEEMVQVVEDIAKTYL